MRKKIILRHNKSRFIKTNKKPISKKTRDLSRSKLQKNKIIAKNKIFLKKKVLRKKIRKIKTLRKFFPVLRKRLFLFSKPPRQKSFYRILRSQFFLPKRESIFFYTYLKSKFKFGTFSRNTALRNLTRSLNKNINYIEKFLENPSPRLTKLENNFFTVQKLGHLRFRNNFPEILSDRLDLQYMHPSLFFKSKQYSDFKLNFDNFDFYTRRHRKRELQKIFMLGNSYLKLTTFNFKKRRSLKFFLDNFERFNLFFLIYTYRFGFKKAFRKFQIYRKFRKLRKSRNLKKARFPIFFLKKNFFYRIFKSKFRALQILRKLKKFNGKLYVNKFFFKKLRRKKSKIRKTYKLLNKIKSVSFSRLQKKLTNFFVSNTVSLNKVKIFDDYSKIIKYNFSNQLGFIGKFFQIKKNFPINNFYLFYPSTNAPSFFNRRFQPKIYSKPFFNLEQKFDNLDAQVITAASSLFVPTFISDLNSKSYFSETFKNKVSQYKVVNYNFDRVHLKHFNKRFFNYSLRTIFRPILRHTTWRLQRDLKAIYGSNYQFFIRYSFLNPKKLSPVLFNRFITRRLTQRFTLFETMKVLKKFLRQAQTRGYLFRASGRFTKKQRASNYVYRHGQVTISTFSREIKYNIENVRLKYGSCSVKLWIDYGGKKN